MTSSVWLSPFRPFFLLGSIYGPLLILSWVPHYTGLLPWMDTQWYQLPSLWHQHEIIFGFSAAIIFGFILTALPSWAGSNEIPKPALVVLVSSWLLGRFGVAMSGVLPLTLVAIMDLSFLLVFILVVLPGLRNIHHRISLGLFVIVGGFFIGNLCYYLGELRQEPLLLQQGLHIGLYAIVFHCSVTLGILGPIFTENELEEQGTPTEIGHIHVLEWLSALSIISLVAADISHASPLIGGSLALISFFLHAMRLYRWRSVSIRSSPIVWVLHLGYAWLCISLGLLALENFGFGVGTESWVHAFTVGGFGLMSLGLMTRVTLRHTGRELQLQTPMVTAFIILAVAALLRIAIPIASLGQELLLLSALLWVVPYLVYFVLYARVLLTPSIPE